VSRELKLRDYCLLEGLPDLIGKLHVVRIRVLVLLPCLSVRDARNNSIIIFPFKSILPITQSIIFIHTLSLDW